jgi:hypothetical protein
MEPDMNNQHTFLPDDPREYEVRAFFDEQSDRDMPALLLRTGELQRPGTRFENFRYLNEMIINMSDDVDVAREFWTRMKAAADVALARIGAVEGAKVGA